MKFGSAGEIITCENGHPVFRLTSDLSSYTLLKPGLFEAVGDVPEPKAGQSIQTSCTCGAPFMRSTAEGWDAHFKDGWRRDA